MRFTTILKAAAAPAIIAGGLLATAAGASASTGPGSFSAAGTQPGSSTLIKATFSYQDPFFGGPVNCQEIHHQVGTQDFDSVSCQTADGSALANVAPGQAGTVGWLSDFALNSAQLTTHPKQADTAQVTLTYLVNAAGTGYTGTTSSYTPAAS